MIKKTNLIIALILLSGCSLSPGMHMETKLSWQDGNEYVYIESIGRDVKLTNISETLDASYKND